MAATSHTMMTLVAGSATSMRIRVLLQAILSVLGASAVLIKVGAVRRFSMSLVIMGLRSMTPLACLLVLRNARVFFRSANSLSTRQLLWYTASVWSLAEVVFLVYLSDSRRALNTTSVRRWTAILQHSTEEKRRASLERYLLMIAQVSRGGSDTQVVQTVTLDLASEKKSSSSPSNRAVLGLGMTSRRPSFDGLRRRLSNSNLGMALTSVGSFSPTQSRREASTDNLLSLICNSERSPHTASEALSDEEFRKLKILEVAGWFHGPEADDNPQDPEAWLRRGNVEDWIAHYWFRGATPEALNAKAGCYEELVSLVDRVLDFTGLVLEHGRNPNIYPRLVMSDPLPVMHRPLLVYVGSSLICPFATLQVMRFLGFRKERVGGLCYWHRGVRDGIRSDIDLAGPRQIPIVFLHGLGVGLVPYYLFIHRLSERYSGEIFVPDLPFLAMMPWERVPSAREVVAQLQDMLAVHRLPGAHFAGHSFGTIVVSWMMKMSPSSIICTTLMEPACILLLKSDQWSQAMWAPPQTVMYQFLRYFVFRELFTVNLLCRCSFWEQSILWPEEIQTPAVVELASEDAVVSSLFVRRLMEHERTARKEARNLNSHNRRGLTDRSKNLKGMASLQDVRTEDVPSNEGVSLEVQWQEGFIHGQILFHRKSTLKLFSRMRQMVQDVHMPHN